MASNVKIKRSATSGKVPLTTDLQLGELAVNTFDGKLYLKKNNGTDVIVEIGASTATTLDTAIITATGSTAALRITNTGTGNSLLVEDSANPDSSPFVIDNAGNVGVGTTSPVSNGGYGGVTIDGTTGSISSFNANAVAVGRVGAVAGKFFIQSMGASDIIAFQQGAGGTERMRLDASGNLGLGVVPSAWATVKVLQINNCSLYGYSTAETGMTGNAYYNAGWKYIATGTATKYTQGEVANGVHAWYNAPSGTAGAVIPFTQAMTLDASGNLGIGTTAPTTFGYNKTLTVSDPTNSSLGIIAGSTAIFLSATATAGNITVTNSQPLLFSTASAERMRLDASGNLGLGVVPSAWRASDRAFDIGSTGSLYSQGGTITSLSANEYLNASSQRIYKTNGFSGSYSVSSTDGNHKWFVAPSGTAGAVFTFTQAMTLNASGNLGIGTTAPATALDVRTASGSVIISGRSSNVGVSSEPGSFQIRAPNASGTEIVWDGIRSIVTNATAGTEAADLVFSTRGAGSYTDKMRLDASGNLGLGVTPSAWVTGNTSALQLKKGSVSSSAGGPNDHVALSANSYASSSNDPGLTTWNYIGTGYAERYEQRSGNHLWYVAPSGTAGAVITFTQAMTLDASGNLGIGTTSPGSKLDVQGAQGVINLTSTTATSSVYHALNNGGGNLWFGRENSVGSSFGLPAYSPFIYSQGAYPLSVHLNGAVRATLDASGNLGIGNTPSGAYKLEVSGKAAATTQVSTNGITVNSQIMTTSQTIAAGSSGFTVGPFSIASGAVLTIEPGARHIII